MTRRFFSDARALPKILAAGFLIATVAACSSGGNPVADVTLPGTVRGSAAPATATPLAAATTLASATPAATPSAAPTPSPAATPTPNVAASATPAPTASATPAPTASATPTATPTSSPSASAAIVFNPAMVSFPNPSSPFGNNCPSQYFSSTVNVTESGYTGTFTVTDPMPSEVTVTPMSGTSFQLTDTKAGSTNFNLTFTDANGKSGQFPILFNTVCLN